MKKIITLLFFSFIAFASAFSQPFNWNFITYQHNPRAEAMGRLHTGLEGDINSILYNPLTTAYLDDLQLSFSSTSPFDDVPKSSLSFFALGAKINDRFKVGLAYHYQLTEHNTFTYSWVSPRKGSATLSLGFKLNKHLVLGVSSNFLFYQSFRFPKILDNNIGLSHKYFLKNKRHFFTTSLRANHNYFFDPIIGLDKTPLTILFTLGASLHLTSKKIVLDKYRLFRLISSIEVSKNISGLAYNYNKTNFFKLGIGNELTILDFLSLRIGYVHWDIKFPDKQNLPYLNKNNITYGFGFKIPVHEVINQERPFNFYLDYCYLPQYYFNNLNPNSPITLNHNFQSISLRMSMNLDYQKSNHEIYY